MAELNLPIMELRRGKSSLRADGTYQGPATLLVDGQELDNWVSTFPPDIVDEVVRLWQGGVPKPFKNMVLARDGFEDGRT